MPTLKELRSQLKKSMKPISKMSRDEVVLMLEKHKVEKEVEIPKKKLVKEHEELVQVLEKPTKKAVKSELKKQSSELKELKAVKEKKPSTKKPIKKEAVKLPESSSDEEPVEKVKKVKEEDKSSSSASLTKKQMWGELRKSGLSSAEAWAKLRE